MHTSLRILFAVTLSLSGIGVVAAPARGEIAVYQIDPTQSHIQIDDTSRLRVDFGGLTSAVALPFLSQVGAGGTGSVLPGIGVSGGLITSLAGTLLVDVTEDPTPSQIQIVSRRTSVTLGSNGLWLPGLPDAGTATSGELAGRIQSDAFGFAAELAIRDAEFSLGHATPVVLTDQGSGSFTFTYGTDGLDPIPVNGTFDYDTNFGVPLGHGPLLEPLFLTIPSSLVGTYAVPAQGPATITLPIDATVNVESNLLRIGAPLTLRIDLSGQIVATRVPEPAATMLGGASLLALAALRRRRGGESS